MPESTPLTADTGPAPVSLAELFSRDPRSYEPKDIKQIIATMRENRSKFVHGNMSAGASPKLTTAQKATSGINLDIKL